MANCTVHRAIGSAAAADGRGKRQRDKETSEGQDCPCLAVTYSEALKEQIDVPFADRVGDPGPGISGWSDGSRLPSNWS